jgi:hypothetical protein
VVRYRITPDRHFPRPEERGPDPVAVEDAFVQAVQAFMREVAVGSLTVVGLEVRRDCSVGYSDGQVVSPDQLGPLVRHLVREECWGNLESGGLSVRVGFDFHLVVTTPRRCPVSEAVARSAALLVEELRPDRPGGQSYVPSDLNENSESGYV